MKHSRRALLAAVPLLVLSGAPAANAEEKAAAPAPPSQEEMMKAWAAVATPGEGHKKLEPFVGSFTCKTKWWAAPGKPPEESDGTSESKWILGGRFVEQRVEGTAMGQPFSGLGYTGYDNYKKRYVGTWMDSMGTMIMTSQGSADSAGKTFTSWSTIDDVMTKKPAKVKMVAKVADADHHAFEMWSPGPDGKLYKAMEIQYTRKK